MTVVNRIQRTSKTPGRGLFGSMDKPRRPVARPAPVRRATRLTGMHDWEQGDLGSLRRTTCRRVELRLVRDSRGNRPWGRAGRSEGRERRLTTSLGVSSWQVKPLRKICFSSTGCAIHVIIMLALRLPTEIDERLARLSARTGRTKSFYAREAILKHLDGIEAFYLAEKSNGESKREIFKKRGEDEC